MSEVIHLVGWNTYKCVKLDPQTPGEAHTYTFSRLVH